ncbi:MAG TPA: Asp-tRNA(Asn)/Glu-tRNA(Gln) amidotransferase GatCAB subunit C [Spongiibacteraceae bacterium]|nr:Asp-tRNA(Asn)/Glu-tRNA(Gln) amidotransferase GatCAB subunit C [Spongiibacteraceae bacterium]HCS26591.1 Asp-tRNA(Asn)/Glu-tRNA(Gln) amidotransferase GatCAB subunit C [Spongiibacteraceae bacterium]|tara:strand:- start:217 stop:504 length:288 start_codon:yes stop_codon:yes gene_type:complete
MAVSPSDIEKIAHLARIRIAPDQIDAVADRISDILAMVDQMQAVDTDNVSPMANPHDAVQRLRKDEVSELNQRDRFQTLAPRAEDGLYLVPKVIE